MTPNTSCKLTSSSVKELALNNPVALQFSLVEEYFTAQYIHHTLESSRISTLSQQFPDMHTPEPYAIHFVLFIKYANGITDRDADRPFRVQQPIQVPMTVVLVVL